jgi:F-box-like
MANNLPNELIREILFPVLNVPDEMFQDVGQLSPFWHPTHLSTALVLGVCKRWMSVAIPLLYRVVVLRSKAQAYALERTLQDHKELGAHIKKLRVEGGYGVAMRTIIILAPNMTDLCLSLDIRSSDSVKGLCRSLSFTNPCCLVILTPFESRTNAPLRELGTKLGVCFGNWTNLVSLSHGTPSVV